MKTTNTSKSSLQRNIALTIVVISALAFIGYLGYLLGYWLAS